MIFRCKAFPRAALVGNPSDGYFGKTIAFVFRNYCAEVELYESPELDLLPSLRDHTTFSGMKELCDEVSLYGYYGGIRLLKASIKKFYEYVCTHSLSIEEKNFTIRYKSSIQRYPQPSGTGGIFSHHYGGFACLVSVLRCEDPAGSFCQFDPVRGKRGIGDPGRFAGPGGTIL